MKSKLLVLAILLALPSQVIAEVKVVKVVADDKGAHLEVAGSPYFVRGMNWGYIPIGHNYSYDLWSKDDTFIETVLHREMKLLKDMGVNSIRLFSVVPPKWVTWMYENYGIRTALNHLMGRYGFNVEGVWVPNIDYANPTHRKAILDDLKANVARYRDTEGVLLWMLGNENNYGLHWTSFEIEPLPGQEDVTRAKPLYTLMEAGAKVIKAGDPNHPISLTNGDLQYFDVIVEHCPSVDIFGSNVYRGSSARDFYERIWNKYKKPAMFTEFGADAFNAAKGQEDALMQAEMLKQQWADIYKNTRQIGGARNAIGGFVFQWSDGWWKYKQEENLDVHDTNASWPNGGYPDFVDGQNNMNEEWFGIAAKGPVDSDGHYEVYPRTAYYVLQEVWKLDPYVEGVNENKVNGHFSNIESRRFDNAYQSVLNSGRLANLEKIRVSQLQLRSSQNFSNRNAAAGDDGTTRFDHTESITFGFEVRPNARARADVNFVAVGNVAQNRLNPLFYENYKDEVTLRTDDDYDATISNIDRLRLYNFSFEVQERYFDIEGFYRVGHHHWGNEGDFFGLYRQAHYGENLDIYNGVAPFGAVFTGHHELQGLKIAFGPELYWGANPSVIAKYRRTFARTTLTLVHQEDLAARANAVTSSVVPEPRSRKTALTGEWNVAGLTLEIGGILAGTRRLDRPYYITETSDGPGYFDSGIDVYENEVQWSDTWGVRSRLQGSMGPAVVHLQGSYMGLVADAGPETLESHFSLTESGRGNHYAAEAGAYFGAGEISFGPKVLYQKPLIGPIDPVVGGIDAANGIFYPGVPLRNVLDDPFVVRDNRETLAAQFTLVFDPNPADWFWAWDRADRESSPFAFGVRSTYWHYPTSQDSRVAIFDAGFQGSFESSVPARDSWRTDLFWVANRGGLRLFGDGFIGKEDAFGEDTRQVFHFGSKLGLHYEGLSGSADVRFNDWGPYDYHRDFNLTYPFQLISELAWGLKPRRMGQSRTQFGVRSIYRQLDVYSEGYADPDEANLGVEYEIQTFMEFAL